MNRITWYTNLFFLLILTGCGLVTIVTAEWEETDKYQVDTGTKPSELINNYLGENVFNKNSNKNIYIVFFSAYCGLSDAHYHYTNMLHKKYANDFEWFAVTNYDSLECYRYREEIKVPKDALIYNFNTFYSIEGLRSSYRNLYYKNNPEDKDISTLSFIVKNDSIINQVWGSLKTEEDYYRIDSIMSTVVQAYN